MHGLLAELEFHTAEKKISIREERCCGAARGCGGRVARTGLKDAGMRSSVRMRRGTYREVSLVGKG